MGISQLLTALLSRMKAFICVALFAMAAADQSHHQVIKQGNAPAVSHSVHKAHGAYAATVASQPHAAPQAVHGYHSSEKYSAAVVAPAAIPAPYTPANVGGYHSVHAPVHAPVHHAVHHAPAYHAPAYDGPAEPYTFEYAVADDYSKAAFNAAESSTGDGNAVGSYSVALPDGRTQHVAYTSNGYDGYVAEVTYEGTAVYPEYKPN